MMFNDLIDDASRRACVACERVRRLDGMVAREYAKTTERTTGEIARLGDTLGNAESLSVDDLMSAAKSLTQAGDRLVKNTLADIDIGRASRAVSATTAALKRIGVKVPGIVQDAGAVLGTAERVGQKLSSALTNARGALDRVDRSLMAAFGGPSPLPPEISTTALTRADLRVPPTSSFANAHLMILSTMEVPSESFFFNLSTAAYDSLRRQTSYNIASQDRLTRLPALQAVSKGEDTITVSGVVITKKSGASQMNRLREIGFRMVPVMLTTGYGEAFGQFYLSRIEEDQGGLFPDGMPRKQLFTLEFQRYGEDYSNV